MDCNPFSLSISCEITQEDSENVLELGNVIIFSIARDYLDLFCTFLEPLKRGPKTSQKKNLYTFILLSLHFCEAIASQNFCEGMSSQMKSVLRDIYLKEVPMFFENATS